jgi:hypothetical protein
MKIYPFISPVYLRLIFFLKDYRLFAGFGQILSLCRFGTQIAFHPEEPKGVWLKVIEIKRGIYGRI